MMQRRYLTGIGLLPCLWTLAHLFVGATGDSVASGDLKMKCEGLSLDYSRVTSVSLLSSEDPSDQNDETTEYQVQDVVPVRVNTPGRDAPCVVQRLRLKETKGGVPIFGANVVATLSDCLDTDGDEPSNAISLSAEKIKQEVERKGLTGMPLLDKTGKTFVKIHYQGSYTPTNSKESVVNFLKKHYQIPPEINDKIEDPKLTIFPTHDQDFLAYFTNVLVTGTEASKTAIYQVFVDANDLTILRACNKTSPYMLERHQLKRGLRQSERRLSKCDTCAVDRPLSSISSTTTTQQINSLYMNNDGRNAVVSAATVAADGSTVYVPYEVDDLYWKGTYHCFSGSDSECKMVELPTSCADALSDVSYLTVETLRFAQSDLEILGGLSVFSSDPQTVLAKVHYEASYCNAYYFNNEVVFGDCDCSIWSPLVTIDVVAHELAHGFTAYSSDLFYGEQSGGLNEGYSDILGTVMEFVLNDSLDTPDFLIGEALEGSFGTLRFMEDPPMDGSSIGSVCDYYEGIDVHYSSGVPNKAFVKSVRACEADPCSSSLTECVLLMGKLFFYTNLSLLTTLSTYLDAAFLTCVVVDEYFTQLFPTTSCTSAQTVDFLIAGWASVDVVIDPGTCAPENNCGPATFSPTASPATDPSQGCSSSLSLTVPSTTFGTTIGETRYESQACDGARGHPSPGIWYQVTGNGGAIEASLCNTLSEDTQLSVWTGSCSNLLCVGGNDDDCGLRSRVEFPTTNGQLYYIYVYGYLGQTFDFELTLSSTAMTNPPTAAPGNIPTDPELGCIGAVPKSVPSTTLATTVGSVLYAPESCGSAGSKNSAGLWYSVTGTGGDITASLCGLADYDTLLSVWTGSCSSLVCVGGNDDSCGLKSTVTWTSVSGLTYYVFVYGYAGATGAFELSLRSASTTMQPTAKPTSQPSGTPRSMEQGCLSATSITTESVTISTTIGEPIYMTDQCDVAYPLLSAGKWYKVIGNGASIQASLCANTFYDTMMSVWSGSCSSLTCEGGSDDSCSLQSSVTFASSSGKNYYVFVHGYNGNTGAFELAVGSATSAPSRVPTPAPQSGNLGCFSASLLKMGSTTRGSTFQQTVHQVPTCGDAASSQSAGKWYWFYGTGYPVTASLCGATSYDSMISAWTIGGDCSSLTCRGGNDDSCNSLKSTVSFPSALGVQYYIFIHGFGGATGSYELQLSHATPPPSPVPTSFRPTPFPTLAPTPIPATAAPVSSSPTAACEPAAFNGVVASMRTAVENAMRTIYGDA